MCPVNRFANQNPIYESPIHVTIWNLHGDVLWTYLLTVESFRTTTVVQKDSDASLNYVQVSPMCSRIKPILWASLLGCYCIWTERWGACLLLHEDNRLVREEVPLTVAARSKAWPIFARWNTGIVGSNLALVMDVCVRLFCMLRHCDGLIPVQGVLPTVYAIRKLKTLPGSKVL
jgi:hypothetical protein